MISEKNVDTSEKATKLLKAKTRLIEAFRREDQDYFYFLSDQEILVLALIAEGLRNKEIATRLSITEKTVKNHVSSVLKTLQVQSRTQAAVKVFQEGLFEDTTPETPVPALQEV